jgi:hypothetical protein
LTYLETAPPDDLVIDGVFDGVFDEVFDEVFDVCNHGVIHLLIDGDNHGGIDVESDLGNYGVSCRLNNQNLHLTN